MNSTKMENKVYERICEVLERCGVEFIEKSGEINVESIDSFVYISTIVELENEFSIEIPDRYLEENIFSSIEGLQNIILDLLNDVE